MTCEGIHSLTDEGRTNHLNRRDASQSFGSKRSKQGCVFRVEVNQQYLSLSADLIRETNALPAGITICDWH